MKQVEYKKNKETRVCYESSAHPVFTCLESTIEKPELFVNSVRI